MHGGFCWQKDNFWKLGCSPARYNRALSRPIAERAGNGEQRETEVCAVKKVEGGARASAICDKTNHLEERLLDQAQARAAYTPLFWGHSRSIPQGMILDVQPLVKSLFCPIRPSPNGFFDSEASTP